MFKGGKQKTTGTEVISSVPVSSNVKKKGMAYSTALTRLNESSKRSAQVDKNYKIMKEAKDAFKGAKKDLQNMVDTGRATKINKKVFRKGVDYDSDALFPTKKKIEKKAKGGRVGLKGGLFPSHDLSIGDLDFLAIMVFFLFFGFGNTPLPTKTSAKDVLPSLFKSGNVPPFKPTLPMDKQVRKA